MYFRVVCILLKTNAFSVIAGTGKSRQITFVMGFSLAV